MSNNTGPQSAYSGDPLPIGTAPPARSTERADAARNRRRILDAAGRLFTERGVGAVSMDQIASAAGVGKGTLFRRFGDKAGLAVALLDDRERELQTAILSGPPPLGPGAPPWPRLESFLRAYVDFLDANLDLVHLSETARPGARYTVGAYRLWHRHVAMLLGQARPELDRDYLAHALLAPLAADLYRSLRDEVEEVSVERMRDGVLTLARSVVDAPVPG